MSQVARATEYGANGLGENIFLSEFKLIAIWPLWDNTKDIGHNSIRSHGENTVKKPVPTLLLACMLATATSLAANEATPVPEVTTLDSDKRAELMADYPNPAWGPDNWYLNQIVHIEDNLYTYANKNNTRTFFLVTDDGVIVGDPISVEDANALREGIRKITDKPVTHVIYSHNHYDHIEGAKVFKDEGATIMSHSKCAERIAYRPNPKVIPPDFTFDGNYILDVGGERIEMHYYGTNHSSCLVFPFLKNGKYLFVVDVVSPGAIPWGIVPDTDYKGSIHTLGQLEKTGFEVAIPGHGAPMVPKGALTERRLYLTALMNAVTEALEPDGFKEDFYEKVDAKMEPWSYMRAFGLQFRQNVESMLYYVGIGE